MSTNFSNPLYPFDEEVSDLEAAAREAEFYDDTDDMLKKKRKRKHDLWSDDEDNSHSIE